MLISFFKHGAGSARAASGYVLAAEDALGAERAAVEVLRGDPETVAAAADSLPFKHRYRSGVIAWAPEDRPTEAQIGAALDDFERLAFAGLEPDRRCWAAVLHREAGGGVHVHVLAARCDLMTGRSFNISPPGWERDYGHLVKALNLEHGWAQPDDPARRQDVTLARHELRIRKLEPGISFEREEITEWITGQIRAGLIENREDVEAALGEIGEITRRGASYISVKAGGAERAVRLKGAVYEQDFQAGEWLRLQPEIEQQIRGQAEIFERVFRETLMRLETPVRDLTARLESALDTSLRGMEERLSRFRTDTDTALARQTEKSTRPSRRRRRRRTPVSRAWRGGAGDRSGDGGAFSAGDGADPAGSGGGLLAGRRPADLAPAADSGSEPGGAERPGRPGRPPVGPGSEGTRGPFAGPAAGAAGRRPGTGDVYF